MRDRAEDGALNKAISAFGFGGHGQMARCGETQKTGGLGLSLLCVFLVCGLFGWLVN